MAAGDNEREDWMVLEQQQKDERSAQREAEMQGEIQMKLEGRGGEEKS